MPIKSYTTKVPTLQTIDATAHRYKAIINGRRNRIIGQRFESIIEASCERYRIEGKADIEKTPEPMKPIHKPNGQGQFLACYTKKAQPDFTGTLAGGRSIIFDAKHTSANRLQRSAITDEQERVLNRREALGADCFILVSFGFQQFFKIPWKSFRDMKGKYGRKYIKPEDVQQYKINYTGNFLRFL